MKLLIFLSLIRHFTVVLSCYNYTTEDRKDFIHLSCLPRLMFFKPWDPAILDVSYKFYNKLRHRNDAPVEGQTVRWDKSFPSKDLAISADDKIVVIFHGYTENADEAWIRKMKSAYFNRPDSDFVKVISVDWEKGALGATWPMSRNFVQAANNARMVGRITGLFLARLMRAHRVKEESLHILGHSLGAHAMGETIKILHEQFGIKAGRATAFDAAAPLFEWNGILPERRHTHYLEALHTSSMTSLIGLFWGQVGVYKAYGHIDMYPNSGSLYQPACKDFNFFFCSHRRAYIYYTDMLLRCVDNCDFEGFECKNEADAVNAQCSGQRLQVWKHMHKKNNNSKIVYFTTDADHIKMSCTNFL